MALHVFLFLGKVPTYTVFGESSHLHCFLRNKYQKIPTYMPLLRPTRLFIFEKSSQLHCFLRNKYQKISTYTPLLR